MLGLALTLCFALPNAPIPLEYGVIELPARKMSIPILYNADRLNEIESMSAYVSTDRGKTWKLLRECKPTDTEVPFDAPRDGLYWFALRVVMKGGHAEPADVNELQAAQKVYVNTAKRTVLKANPSPEDWKKEIAELKAQVTRLQKRIDELEAQRKGN